MHLHSFSLTNGNMLSLSAIYFTSFVMIIPVLIREDEGLQVPIVQRREMEPRYGGPSVLEETPYKLSIDKEVIKWCEKVNINIKGKGTICFKGFYFQVKDALNYTIGHFEPGRRIKLLDCSHQRRVSIQINDLVDTIKQRPY